MNSSNMNNNYLNTLYANSLLSGQSPLLGITNPLNVNKLLSQYETTNSSSNILASPNSYYYNNTNIISNQNNATKDTTPNLTFNTTEKDNENLLKEFINRVTKKEKDDIIFNNESVPISSISNSFEKQYSLDDEKLKL